MRKILLSSLLFLVLMFVLGTVFTLLLPKVTLVQDRTFSMNYPLRGIGNLGHGLFVKGYRLSVVGIENAQLTDPEGLKNLLAESSASSRMVICSPVVTAAARAADIRVKDLGSALSVGIAAHNDGLFDMVLVSQSSPEDAAEGEVDYRYAGDRTDASAVIYPDLALSVIPLLETDRPGIQEGFLFYDTYKTR